MTDLAAASSFLRSRLRPRPQLVPLVERDRLLAWLDADVPSRLVWIGAPPGAGKTTMMEQAYARVGSCGGFRAWLSLTDQEATTAAFSAALIHAVALSARDEPAEPGRDLPEAFSQLCGGRHIWLFLDDWDRAECAETEAVLRLILAEYPGGITVVVGSRTASPLTSAALLMRGGIIRFDFDNLCFTRGEIAGCAGADPSAGDLDAIWTETHGWPALVQLARLGMMQRRSFGGSGDDAFPDAMIADYVSEEILGALVSPERQAMICGALFDELSADLLDIILERSDSMESIDALRRRHLIAEAGSSANWYRMMPVLAAHVRRRRFAPSRAIPVRQIEAVCDFLVRFGRHDDAVRFVLRAGAPEMAAALFERGAGYLLTMRWGFETIRLFREFDIPGIERFPQLALALIYLDLQEERVARARAAFERLRGEDAALARVDDANLRLAFSVVEGLLCLVEDREMPVRVTAAMETALDENSIGPVALRSALCVLVSHYLDTGDYAEGLLRASVALLSAGADAPYVSDYLDLCLSLANGALGNMAEAEAHARSVERRNAVGRGFPEEAMVTAYASFLLAQIRYETGDIEGAWEISRDSAPALPERHGWLPAYEAATPTVASLLRRKEGIEPALHFLHDQQGAARRNGFDRLELVATASEMHQLALAGRIEEARKIAEQPTVRRILSGAEIDSRASRLAPGLFAGAIRLALCGGDLARAKQMLGTLKSFDRHGANERLQIPLMTLEASLMHLSGAAEPCVAICGDIGRRLTRSGRWTYLADEPRALVTPLLAQILPKLDAVASGQTAFVVQLLEGQCKGVARKISHGGPHLSPREREVLEMLADGYSAKEMANQLGLMESTLKGYRKALFSKLNAHTRSRALRAARELNLIETRSSL
ncbi:regulatory protein, LuxR [Rhizorhabdus wittichii RW1]|uniref:Regulatory protein, LuxR n=1 Tax=Rhizorhabdus wittichii (strain DSM 6014 / CCUG 31198 / JCM 15750 / NBRC 105917 / EY 4224 / RW1) TaxID=392499 RepID=A0A9J9LB77_RHIWR|nr:regulatory protein, LuxR [Rhizorhabdus wittichii RW1]